METSYFLIISILLLLLLSAFFSGSEAALFSLPAARLKSYRTNADARRRLVASLLSRPRDLLVTIFILNTAVNILLQNVAASLFGDFSGWILKVGVPLVLTLIFGEILPKYIGLQHNFQVSYLVTPLIAFLQKLMRPVCQAIISITTPLSRILFFYLRKAPEITHEELQHILKTSEQHGVFTKDEGEILSGYIYLQDATAKELMRPRDEILFYNIQDPLTTLLHLLIDERCSRVPVCEGILDNVVGIISVKNFFTHRLQIMEPKDLLSILAKPFYIPESTPARLLMRRFAEQQQTLALIVNEYGSITGLLTYEDLLEVVIGEIPDSRDQGHLYTKSGEYEIIASGKLELEEFNDLFGVNFISPNEMVTIGGWLMERLGEIPKSGSSYELDHFLFQVLAATDNRIRRLYIRKLR